MPRADGVSFSSTVWRMRSRPMLRTTAAWFRLKPTGLRISVTLTVPAPFEAVLRFAMFGSRRLHGRAREIAEFLASEPGDHRGILQRVEIGRAACGERVE